MMGNLKSQKTTTQNCVLTKQLRNTLVSGAKVLMFLNIAPEAKWTEETKESLGFGDTVGSVKLGSAVANKI